MSLNINKVWLKKDGTEVMVPAKDIKKGDIVVARMGEVVTCCDWKANIGVA